mgnify:CR=1 FL=1
MNAKLTVTIPLLLLATACGTPSDIDSVTPAAVETAEAEREAEARARQEAEAAAPVLPEVLSQLAALRQGLRSLLLFVSLAALRRCLAVSPRRTFCPEMSVAGGAVLLVAIQERQGVERQPSVK